MNHGSDNGVDFYRTSKFDWILIGLILFFAIGSFPQITHHGLRQSSQSTRALIYQKGALLEKIDLGKDKIIPLFNGRMHIEVKNRKVRVLNSDCPQALCVNIGWIRYSGQTIVCAPNKIVIEVKSARPQLLDAVVY